MDTLATSVQQPSALLKHLDVLRRNLFRMLIAVALGVFICSTFTSNIIDFLAKPIGGLDELQALDLTETVVIGIPDEQWGEVAKARVVLKPGVEATEA